MLHNFVELNVERQRPLRQPQACDDGTPEWPMDDNFHCKSISGGPLTAKGPCSQVTACRSQPLLYRMREALPGLLLLHP